MSSDDFSEQIRSAGAAIGDIFREDTERQRREVTDRIRAMLSVARTKAGGELAESLLQVMLVMDRWHGEALASANPPAMIGLTAAADEILTAIETGFGATA
jgi:hypothetical protein